MEHTSGSASVLIERTPDAVFDAISDVTRMGDWSPENTACRWVDGATGPAVGARFEGDNEAKLGPVTVKRWTTVSEITECSPGRVFEFVAADQTTWRFELDPVGDATRVTESYSHAPYTGLERFLYETLGKRSKAVPKAMQRTLDQIKASLES